MWYQIVKAVDSVERSRQLLADGELQEAFLVSRQASDASGILTIPWQLHERNLFAVVV